jgi:hypothetical protein
MIFNKDLYNIKKDMLYILIQIQLKATFYILS